MSTGSPATTVTWEKDGVPLSIDGSTYQLTQTVINRTTSTYSNVLTVSEAAPTGVAGTYSCNVSNQIGWDTESVTAVGMSSLYNYSVEALIESETLSVTVGDSALPSIFHFHRLYFNA